MGSQILKNGIIKASGSNVNANLCKNSNFLQGTNGLEGWNLNQGATATKQTDCVKIVSNNVSGGIYTLNYDSITTGTMTTFNAYVKTDTSMNIYIGVDGSGNGSCQEYTIGTEWKRISITKAKTENNPAIRVYGNGTFYVKMVKYELGSNVTPWLPNSSDTNYNNTTCGFNEARPTNVMIGADWVMASELNEVN